MLRFLFSMGREYFEGTYILTSFRTTHLCVEHGVIHLSHNTFTTSKDRGVVMQERQPQMDILPFRCLVADIAEERTAIITTKVYEIAENIFFGYAYTTMGRAQSNEQTIEGIAVEWMVDETRCSLWMALEGQS